MNNHINLKENKTLPNPYVVRYISKKCSKTYYLIENTFLVLFPFTNATTIINILNCNLFYCFSNYSKSVIKFSNSTNSK